VSQILGKSDKKSTRIKICKNFQPNPTQLARRFQAILMTLIKITISKRIKGG